MSRLRTLETEGIRYELFAPIAQAWKMYVEFGVGVEVRRDIRGHVYQYATFNRLSKLTEALCLDSNN